MRKVLLVLGFDMLIRMGGRRKMVVWLFWVGIREEEERRVFFCFHHQFERRGKEVRN